MDGMSNERKTSVDTTTRSFDGSEQDESEANTVEDQILSGVVESLTDDTGVISFSFNTLVKKVKFSRSNVVIDNMKLTKKISLLNILKIGTQVTFSVEYSNQKDGVNFKASVIEVKGPVKCPQCLPEEIKYVHNKVFFGKIESLDGFSGTIVFELDNRSEKAVFSKDCVYVSEKKLKDNPVPLIVGKPVCLMVVHYSGVNGCNFMAIIVQTKNESELNLSTSVEGNVLLHHSLCYGTIKDLNEISGKIAFLENDEEKEVIFYRSSVIVNKLKLVKNVPLPSVLKVGMPVAFMIDNSSLSVFAKVVEVFQDEYNGCCYSGVLGTIATLSSLSGTVTFLINNEEKKALFFRKSVINGSEMISESASLLTVLKIGWHVILEVVSFEEKNSDFIATSVVIPRLKNLAHCPSTVDNVTNEEVLNGVIQKIGNETGIVEFHVNGETERAIFFRNSVFINKERISKDTLLSKLLHISMPVSIKVIHCTTPGFNFIAVSVEVLRANFPCCIPSVLTDKVVKNHGTVLILTESYGVITFCVDNIEEKAVMYREELFINDKRVSKKTSLLTLLDIGMPISFTAISYTGFKECNYKVIHLEVASLKSSPLLGQNFCGIIEHVSAVGGSISFQINGMTKKAIFHKENIHVIGRNVNLEVLSIIKVGIPVSFRLGEARDDDCFEASAVVVEALHLQQSPNDAIVKQSSNVTSLQQPSVHTNINQKSFDCHGIIKQLGKTSGIASFQMNNIEEKAIFFKKSVRIYGTRLKPRTSLSDVLKIGMQVLMTIERSEETKDYHFKASLIHVRPSSKYLSANSVVEDDDSQFYYGIVQEVRNTCGMITFNMNGKQENAIFFNHCVLINNKFLDKNTSLNSVLNCGIKVYLSVKRCAELCDCNFVATAVGICSPGVNNKSLVKCSTGTIVALDAESGVVTFWLENKQQKAVFYKKAVHINDDKLKGKVSLLSVLRVGMCVLLEVKKLQEHCFYYRATHVGVMEDIKETYVTKVSSSKHITCGLGIVTEIISSTVARLQFEVDELKDGLFKLSDFFVNGQRCDDSKELSAYISKGDVYSFDASRNNKNEGDSYLITCVWHGEKPELSTLMGPYRTLTENCQQMPSSAEGTVIALFPPQAAIVKTEVCGAVLLFVDSLSCENDTKRLTKTDWIQDYLSVGDTLTLELNKSQKVYCFPLVKCARKATSNRPGSQQKSDLISKLGNNSAIPIPVFSASNVEYSSTSIASSMSSPSHSVGSSNSPFTRNTPVSDRVKSDVGDKVFSGTINSLTSFAGTIAVERDNRKEIVQFTKAVVHINNQELSSNLSLLSVLQVGMPVTLRMISCSESENSTYKAVLVEVSLKTPDVDNKLFYGSIESVTNQSGVVTFNLDNNKVERASFQCRHVSINKIKHPALMMIIEVGMRASLMVKHISDSVHCKYEAMSVNIEVPDSFLAAYGFETSSSPKQDVPNDNKEFCGFIYSLTDISGTIAFKMHDKNCRAIFSKNAVCINNTDKVPPKVSLLRFMELGMDVVLTLESFQGIFKAKLVKVISTWLNTPEDILDTTELSDEKEICKPLPLLNVTDLELKETEGKITGYLSSSIGIIECNINGEKYEACFTEDIVICDQMIDNELQKLFPLGVIVKFDGKLESFMDKHKLRILCIWHHQASKKLRKKLWNFDDSLSNGGEYSGTVIEILKADTFIVAIKNVPILVGKKYLSEPAKFVTLSRSIWHGDRITVVIQRTDNGKEMYNWFASDAWRTRDASDISVTPQKEITDLRDGMIMVGKLVTVDKSSGVLLDDLYRISFQSTDASLFGVSLKDVDLTEVFIAGDIFNYCICQESRVPKVWYGPQEFKDIYHQFHELFNFCCSRSTSAALVYSLTRKLGNQRGLHKQDLVNLDVRRSSELCWNQQNSNLSENYGPVQQDSTKRKSLNGNTCPSEEGQSKCVKPVPVQRTTTSKNLKSVADQRNLDSSENQKTVLQSASCSSENTESVQQFKTVLSDAKEQFKCLNQQLTQFTCPVLTKEVKHILSQFLLSLTSKDNHNEVYCEVINKMFASVECHVKDCISGHLLNEIISDSKTKAFQFSEVKSKSTSVDQLQESVQGVNILVPSGNKTLENVVHKLEKDKVVYVDRGTQTLSTGSVLFTHVVPG